MDKETLSNYGWIVICVLVLAVMIALAGPFGTFVAGAVKSTTAGLFGVNQNALGAAGIEIGDQAFANCEHLETEIRNATADYSGDTCCKECGTILSTGTYVIPEGGKYTAVDGTVYNPGDGFPETVTTGDEYQYQDYRYRYNQYRNDAMKWVTKESQNGWGVLYIGSKSEASPILSHINNEPVTTMSYAFDYSHSGLTVAPIVPDTMTNMCHAFNYCRNLTTAPIIPDSVTNIEGIFYYCQSLKTYAGSTDADGDMTNYIIPSHIKNWNKAFYYCESIIKAPTIPEGVSEFDSTFYKCTSLTAIPKLPETARLLDFTFCYCTGLNDVTGLVLPKNIVRLYSTFSGCTNLTGTITINAEPWGICVGVFDNTTKPIYITGTSTYLQRIADDTNNGNVIVQ